MANSFFAKTEKFSSSLEIFTVNFANELEIFTVLIDCQKNLSRFHLKLNRVQSGLVVPHCR